MIAHLRVRERALVAFGWTGRRPRGSPSTVSTAESSRGSSGRVFWIAITRKLHRDVRALVAQGVAVEEKALGIERRLLPRRLYRGAAGNTCRSFPTWAAGRTGRRPGCLI